MIRHIVAALGHRYRARKDRRRVAFRLARGRCLRNETGGSGEREVVGNVEAS